MSAVIIVFVSGSYTAPMYSSSSMIYILTKTTSVTSLADIQMGEKLTVDFESDYGGYFTMKVSLDGKHLNEFSGQINMNRNSLEE